jgi:hypothetical protein
MIDLDKQMSSPVIMNLKEIGDQIGRKDIECIKKWLNENCITIHRLGKLTCVYRVDFECTMMLPQIKDYKRRYPTQWESYYRQIIKDDALYYMIMLRLEADISHKPLAKVKRRSQSDEKLYNRLTR